MIQKPQTLLKKATNHSLQKPKYSTNRPQDYQPEPEREEYIDQVPDEVSPQPSSNGELSAGDLELEPGEDGVPLEERLVDEENVLNYHLECVKSEAQLITVEGEIITTLEKAMVNNEDYDMDAYLDTAQKIAEQKL